MGFGQNGLVKEYYDNGKIKKETNYKDGKKNGSWTLYWENGQLQRQTKWVNGKLISKKCWDEEGKKRECD